MPTHGSWSRLMNWRTPRNWCLRLIVLAGPTFASGAVLLSQKTGCKHVFSEMKTWNQWIGYTGRRLVESGPWSRPVKESQSPMEKLHFKKNYSPFNEISSNPLSHGWSLIKPNWTVSLLLLYGYLLSCSKGWVQGKKRWWYLNFAELISTSHSNFKTLK